MAILSRPSDLIRLVPAGGGMTAGLAVAAVVALLPVAALERLVWSAGLPAILAAARPPFGATARWLLAAGGGVAAAAVCWAALFLLVGPDGLLTGSRNRAGGARFRRADRHPDAPPRQPMTAADLGTPLMDIVMPAVDQEPPGDRDETLAIREPSLSSMDDLTAAMPLAPGERLDTFTLTPPPPTRPATPGSPPSIDALLRRLEAGAARRPARL